MQNMHPRPGRFRIAIISCPAGVCMILETSTQIDGRRQHLYGESASTSTVALSTYMERLLYLLETRPRQRERQGRYEY